MDAARLLVNDYRAGPDHVNSNGCTPLQYAILNNNADAVRLLVEELRADPCLAKRTEGNELISFLYPIDIAISEGNSQIVSFLLQHGAFLDTFIYLFKLLQNPDKDYDTKLEICRNLYMAAGSSFPTIISTLDSLQAAIVFVINKGENEVLKVLLEAGIPPSFRNNQAFHHAVLRKNIPACQLLVLHGANPFFEEEDDDDDDDVNHPTVLNKFNCRPTNQVDWSSVHGGPGRSPFHSAARQADTFMFEHLWENWFERFETTNGGVNDKGEYPIHAICRDKHVSLAAIQLLLQDGFAEHASETPHGLYPYQISALNEASLDVVFTLFQHRVGVAENLVVPFEELQH